MIKEIYINGNSSYNRTRIVDSSLPEFNNTFFELAVTFYTDQEAYDFHKRFKKSLGIRRGQITYYDKSGKEIRYPHVFCRQSKLTKVTGEVNETGSIRMRTFYSELQKIYTLKNS